jgi:hypothetical protein
MLAPDIKTVIVRDAQRDHVAGPEWAHYLDGELRRTMAGIGLRVDSSGQAAEETVDEIMRRVWDEGLIES